MGNETERFKNWKELEEYKASLQKKKKTLVQVQKERRELSRKQLAYDRASPHKEELKKKKADEERMINDILKDIDNGD